MPDIILNTSFNNPNLPSVQYPGFIDNFNAPDGQLDVTTDGKEWELHGTGSGNTTHIWRRVSGAAQMTQGQAHMQAVVDGLSANGVLTQVIRSVGTGHVGGMTLRHVDSANWIALMWRISGSDFKYSLQKRVAGTSSVVQSASAKTSENLDSIAATMAGNQISVAVNGTSIIGPSTVTDFATSTKHGLYSANADTTGLVESIQFVAA